MKELSIEEKAKCYDEALAKAVKMYRNYKGRVRAVDVVIKEVFTEFQESEDEKIRKEICKLLWDNAPYEEAQEYIAWLEKQGNPTEDELEALRMAAYEPTKNWSEKLQSLYEKLTHCEQKPVFEMKTPDESLGIDSDTYNKIVDECIYGEQKPADVEEVDFFDDFRKTDSEVEPKFKVSDWVVRGNIIAQILDIQEQYYVGIDINGNDFTSSRFLSDDKIHIWTIQDAKDGDILVCGKDKRPFIFKDLLDKFHPNNPVAYCGIDCSNEFFISIGTIWWTDEEVEPATKEQRDLLFQKMKEAGYEWDADKKELKKIEQKPVNKAEPKFKIGDNIEPIDTCLGSPRTIYKICDGFYETNQGTLDFEFENNWRLTEQKSAWGEEDETKIKSIIALLKSPALCTMDGNKGIINESIKYLKSIKYRVQPKQEWSGEDERTYKSVLYAFEHNYPLNNEQQKFVKSFKDRYTWKPSDEQLNNILDVLSFDNCTPKRRELLESLYIDLKKLIEE